LLSQFATTTRHSPNQPRRPGAIFVFLFFF